jgi:hypothetical protein
MANRPGHHRQSPDRGLDEDRQPGYRLADPAKDAITQLDEGWKKGQVA